MKNPFPLCGAASPPSAIVAPSSLPALDVAQHALVLRPGDLRPLEGRLLERVAEDGDRPHLVLEPVDKGVVDALLHEDARRRRADLALVRHDADVRPGGGELEVGVVEDEQGGLAARLERDVLHGRRRHAHDLLARRGAAREGDLVDVRVLHQRGAGLAPAPVDDVDHARREAGLLDQPGDVEHGQRRLLRQLEHDGVAAGQRGAQLPGRHAERVVPRDDLAAHADGLLDGVGHLVRPGVDDLAEVLVRPAGIVAQDIDKFGYVLAPRDRIRLAVV